MATFSALTPRVFISKYLWLILGILGALGFLTVFVLLPHKSEIDSPWQVIYKLFVFLLLSGSICLFPNQSRSFYLLLLIPILGFLGFIIPRLSYLGFIAVPQSLPNADGEYYTYLYLLLYPAILLSISFAYRLGGGTPGNCLKLLLCGALLIFSGFLDISWYLVNPTGIPSVVQHAHHIEIILGHYPSYSEAIIFALAHVPFMIILLLLPFDKWIQRILPSEYQTGGLDHGLQH